MSSLRILLSRQGGEAPTFSLNGPRRQMSLTATCASAFDSIIRQGVGLLYQRNYLKCLLFHHPKMSAFFSFTCTSNYHGTIHHTSASGSQSSLETRDRACSQVYRSRSLLNWEIYVKRPFITGHLHGQKYRAAIVDFLIETQHPVQLFLISAGHQHRTVLPLV